MCSALWEICNANSSLKPDDMRKLAQEYCDERRKSLIIFQRTLKYHETSLDFSGYQRNSHLVEWDSLGKKFHIYPNIDWLKGRHATCYAGNYVAVENDKVVASGKTIKDAINDAKKKNVNIRYLHYII
jgi:Family of unknown function (DUF5678)